ncbi:MAG: hypothetical protein DM484_14020 [Candidatus Methylumidiphilus alinenensis]|uniref:DUF2442 domain-containing protein n=1 Tax=Candidatus Methylumidiphilus alinenensis TaxID=2202197 RepID=A0A2W4R3R7_9GAMM|nr:MAG: hypothetical protein DM484_14020 [Candidatus Methylumidiphilus alinenensis]
MLYEITDAKACPNHTVTLMWSDGTRGVVDFTPYLAKGGLFNNLKDPDYFIREMRMLRGGIGLTWPNEVDFSSDGLRHDAFPKEETGEFDGLPVTPWKSVEQTSPHFPA